jgi:uncharacterized RDD family membrane protein YckC
MASTDYRVLTPERVSLQYDIAGIGSRGAAALIDSLIQGLLSAVFLIALAGGAAVVDALTDQSELGSSILLALAAIVLFVLTMGYYMLFEILWSGQTPGKRILGVRVLRENGYPIRPVDAVIRNVVRVVDSLPFGYAVGVVTMLLNARARRLGDFAAGTIVVREGGRGTLVTDEPPAVPSAAERGLAASSAAQAGLAQPEARGPTLRGEDATLVRDFLFRRSGMSAPARTELATRLAAVLAGRYGLVVEGDAEAFLERLAV